VIDIFGRWIVDSGGEVDRAKLGRLVFNDPEALRQLETIVHPLVEQAVDLMIRRASQKVVVIEAIKLLESKLVVGCDTIWTTYAPEFIQKTRLMQKRNMNEQDALQRIHAQPPQEVKTAAAHVVIQNIGSFEDTWKQVVAAWKVISPAADARPVVISKSTDGELSVQRGRLRDSAAIAGLITKLSNGTHPQSQADIMAAFGEKAFLLLMADKSLVGLIGWQVENLVARITDIYIDAGIPVEKALKILATEVERASQDLQCEACLFFLPSHAAGQELIWQGLGYTRRTLQTLGVQAWRDAALESQPPDTILLLKQLRQDRIMRPI
jgi:dephospho-CoA kinase